MTRSESITHLATALARAQAEMPVAVFDATNPFLKSKYASLRSVIQASRPILAKHKLSLVQFPIGGGGAAGDGTNETHETNETHGTQGNKPPQLPLRQAYGGQANPLPRGGEGMARPTDFVGVESILMHESGEFVAERIVISLSAEKGKTKVQCAGSTLTYLRRYAWAAILGMYSDEDSDGSSPVQAFTPKPTATLPPPPLRKADSRN